MLKSFLRAGGVSLLRAVRSPYFTVALFTGLSATVPVLPSPFREVMGAIVACMGYVYHLHQEPPK